MKNLLLGLAVLLTACACEQPSRTLSNRDNDYNTLILQGCEYWVQDHGKQMAHKGNCSNPIHAKDTVYVYGVSMRYGTRDTIFTMYPIDSAEVAVGYLKSNGALKGITE